MIEVIRGLPSGIDGMRAGGLVTREDYDAVVLPFVRQAERDRRRLRILCQVDDDFAGVTPAGLWEDVRLGVRVLGLVAGCAVATDLSWVRASSMLAAFLAPCPVRTFGRGERLEAQTWLGELTDGPRIRSRLVPATGVVVVEIDQPLGVQDIDALLDVLDPWLRTHRELPGMVLHAPSVPGWENLPALLHHLGFVAGHQRRIRRLALAVGGALPGVGAMVADRVLHPEVRRFAYDESDAATAWAGAEQPVGSR